MPARFVTTSLVTKRAGIAARFVTLVTKRAVVTKRAPTGRHQSGMHYFYFGVAKGGSKCSSVQSYSYDF